MAFFDWNQDGKKDWQDDFLEYNIYKECTKEDDEEDDDDYSVGNNSSNSGCGFWICVCIVLVIIGMLSK